jgi:hypothetical protein
MMTSEPRALADGELAHERMRTSARKIPFDGKSMVDSDRVTWTFDRATSLDVVAWANGSMVAIEGNSELSK